VAHPLEVKEAVEVHLLQNRLHEDGEGRSDGWTQTQTRLRCPAREGGESGSQVGVADESDDLGQPHWVAVAGGVLRLDRRRLAPPQQPARQGQARTPWFSYLDYQ
jgi:hypothetical protein